MVGAPYTHNFMQGMDSVHINQANMNMNVNHHHGPGFLSEEQRVMSILTNHCANAAQFDFKDRQDAPRCKESTRENILKKIRDWVEAPAPLTNGSTTDTAGATTPNQLTASLFWLHGGAGAGKSALAQSLAEEVKETENIASTFFFNSLDPLRNNGDRIFPTIIYQLTKHNSDFEKLVIEQLKKNHDIFNHTRQQQVKILFTDLLNRLHSQGVDASKFPRLIVIDGLDECKDTAAQDDILSIVAQTIIDLRYPFRFFIASRPETQINTCFEHNRFLKRIPVQKYDLSKDVDAEKDIRTFLQSEFKRLCEVHPVAKYLKNWPTEEDITTLIDRSSGHFVYPATVIRYIEPPRCRPEDKLQIVLRHPSKTDEPFGDLDELYKLILRGEGVDNEDFIKIQRSFSILYLISEKIGYFIIYRSGSSRIIQDMLLLRPGDLDRIFYPLGSLVAQETEEENLHVFHKTLFDFLLNDDRSGNFALSKKLCHESAALYMYNTDILTSWSYAPDFMTFGYHCYLAQPIQDKGLESFLRSLDFLYTQKNSRQTQSYYQNEKALLLMFIDEGEQSPGAKTIFYILRMLALLGGFKPGEDLHDKHCKKIIQFYDRLKPQSSNGANANRNGSSTMAVDGSNPDEVIYHAIEKKLTSWKPSNEILAFTTAKYPANSIAARDALINREHEVFRAYARGQHLPNGEYSLQSKFLPESSEQPMVTHTYHTFSVEYENDPSLMLLLGTYLRGETEATITTMTQETLRVPVAGAVYSAQSFDVTLLTQSELEEQMDKFLDDHVAKVNKELVHVVDDQFESNFEF